MIGDELILADITCLPVHISHLSEFACDFDNRQHVKASSYILIEYYHIPTMRISAAHLAMKVGFQRLQ